MANGTSAWLAITLLAAFEGLGATVARAQDEGLGSEAELHVVAPRHRSYGTGSTTTHVLQASAFEVDAGFDTAFNTNGFFSRYCAGPCIALNAPVMLPAGALVEAIELEACDTSATASFTTSLRRVGQLESSVTSLAEVSTGDAATPGCAFFPVNLTPPHRIDNETSTYVVTASTNGTSDTTRIQAVRIVYRLQVSPAPATATFPSDVPTSHPFFRFVEALAAAGITGGCGPGSYCPDSPVTRGQMAVFLATALGLHFPN